VTWSFFGEVVGRALVEGVVCVLLMQIRGSVARSLGLPLKRHQQRGGIYWSGVPCWVVGDVADSRTGGGHIQVR
jgi:hypothetical protein